MTPPRHNARPTRRRQFVLALAVLFVFAFAGAGIAVAYWLTTDSASPARVGADTLAAGPQPTLGGINGQDVTISWPPTATVGGRSALGYTVARYPAATGGSPLAAGGGCTATVAGTSCTETAPAGTWFYALTPRIHNWAGPEGLRSTTVSVVAPALSFTAGQTVPALPGTVSGGSIARFKAGEGLTLHLDTAAGTTLSGSVAAVDGAGQASGFTVTIPVGATDGVHVVVAVGTAGSQATSNAFTVDTRPPVVTIDSVSNALLGASDASTNVTWRADEVGTYSVRVGGSDCATGTSVAGAAYIAAAQLTTTVSAAALVEGTNLLRVCVTDSSAHAGSSVTTLTLDTYAPTGGSVTYTDGYFTSLSVAITLAPGPTRSAVSLHVPGAFPTLRSASLVRPGPSAGSDRLE